MKNRHDTKRRKEGIAFSVVKWLVQHGWISGFGLAGYGLAEMGYTDRPDISDERFVIYRGKV